MWGDYENVYLPEFFVVAETTDNQKKANVLLTSWGVEIFAHYLFHRDSQIFGWLRWLKAAESHVFWAK